jgi:predicted RNA-binding Zn-ribbon protein involved in translation (DUF1610 family)
MALAVQQRRQATVALRRKVAVQRRKCPACGGTMVQRDHWGLTGNAFVCQKCITSIAE